ncbi:Gfo/Idh/MocA family protein [Nocardioides sp. GCM10027113]|uniref:Gfo/Idh/MocA family protein n=1 Tax=unclassified Nocardioides TaxID=2615069 RepID=UPI003621EF4E
MSSQEATTGWGVLATGRIARSFARDLREVPGARLAAVGSRSEGSAHDLAEQYGDSGTRAHGSYEALVADPSVDVVYVASPHALHLEHARLALEAGKHVLCEKPLTLNLAEAREMVDLAAEHDRFLMEAMWMTCHPVIRAVRDELQAGRFGRPRQLHADLGFVVSRPAGDRLVEPDLGAGALLDMGVYPLTLADLLLGPAEQATAVAGLSDSGFDLDVAIATRHADGAVAALTASMTSWSPRHATLATDAGRVELPADFHHPPYAVWVPHGGEPVRIEGIEPLLGGGLGNEAAEVQRCLALGLRDSPLAPHDRTLRLMETMDALRRQVGVAYPQEAPRQP